MITMPTEPGPLEDELKDGTFFRCMKRCGLPVSNELQQKLAEYIRLLQALNPVAGLVSINEIHHLVTRHLLDSLSLAYPIRTLQPNPGIHLDIGSGGGFPAVPLALMFTETPFCLIERSSKKIGFLRKVISEFKCSNITLINGVFPEACSLDTPAVITARAVEQPHLLHNKLIPLIEAGAVFFCQTEPSPVFAEKMFHVEQWEDEFSEKALRRGRLFIVKK